MKKQLLLLAMILLPMVASADAVEIDGIYYNLFFEEKIAEVTKNPDKYTGEVVIPESVTYEDTDYSVKSIGDHAFFGCHSLTSVTIPNSVTSIGMWAFRNCKELENVVLPNQLEFIGQDAFGYCEKLKDVVIPSSVKEIGPGAFNRCKSIESFVVPEGITVISDGTFEECTSLKSVSLPNTLISIEQEAFAFCTNLTSIEFPSSLKSVGIEAFNGAGLTSLHIPASLTQMAFDGEYWPFTNCNLSSITVAEGNPVYDSRENCNAIIKTATNTLILGCTSTTFPSNVTTIGKWAFYWVPFQYIEIPNSIQVIEEGAFNHCDELTQVKLPNALMSIEPFTFDCCQNLQSITLPESIQSIGERAFSLCFGLTSVTIPNSVTSIGYGAFAASGLTSIKVLATTPPTAYSESFSKYTIPLYVPAESVDAYKAAEPWKNFVTIQAIAEAKVKLSKTKAVIEKGKTLTLKAKVYPTTEDQTVTWKSSDKTVATVTSAGKVKAVGVGTAKITCTSKATGAKATCKVTVGYVKLSKTEVVIEKGEIVALKSKVYPTTLKDQSVTWESSDPTIVKVGSTGKIKGMKVGKATITCTSNATGLKATCEVTVGYVKLSDTMVTIEKGKTKTLKAKVYPTTEDQSVTWESSDPTIVKVTSTGKIKGLKVGKAVITCTSNATGQKATCKVTVVKASSAPSLDDVTGIEE